MSRYGNQRTREFGPVKISTHGNSHGITIPSELRETTFPYERGEKLRVVLIEDRPTGEAKIHLVPEDNEMLEE